MVQVAQGTGSAKAAGTGKQRSDEQLATTCGFLPRLAAPSSQTRAPAGFDETEAGQKHFNVDSPLLKHALLPHLHVLLGQAALAAKNKHGRSPEAERPLREMGRVLKGYLLCHSEAVLPQRMAEVLEQQLFQESWNSTVPNL